MKTLCKVALIGALTVVWLVCWGPAAPIPAFPGAEGYGALSIGGRGGRVIAVTSLSDDGPGSFRDAVTQRGPRTVIFRVSGYIDVKRRIDIVDPYITIAGQTAPGDGVTLRGTAEGGGQMLRIRTHDVVIRHLAVRSGLHGQPGRGQVNVMLDPLPADGERNGDIYNVVLDHLSVSWSLDENIAVFRNVPETSPEVWPTYPEIYDISIQHCLIAEGLHPHSTGLQAGGERVGDEEGRSVFNGGLGVRRLSIHRNLFASNSHRNPGLGVHSAGVINNLIYNWGSKAAETHDAVRVDWIANVFQPGPLSSLDHTLVHNAFFKGHSDQRFPRPSIYMKSNKIGARPDLADWASYTIHYEGVPLPPSYKRDKPLPAAPVPVKVADPNEVADIVLSTVGSRHRLTEHGESVDLLDPVDARITKYVAEGGGPRSLTPTGWTHLPDPADVGGYPDLAAGEPYVDKDLDGIADDWEQGNGLDSAVPDPPDQDTDGDGYTDLEEFLNQTDPNRMTR
jgi:hypothetical protein